MGESGATADPGSGCAVVGAVGVVVPVDGVSPPEGVGDTDVEGAAGALGLEERLGLEDTLGLAGTWGLAGKLGAGTDAREPPADERACANAALGSSSTRAIAARTGGLGVSIKITMALPAVPTLVTIDNHLCCVHNLASDQGVAPSRQECCDAAQAGRRTRTRQGRADR